MSSFKGADVCVRVSERCLMDSGDDGGRTSGDRDRRDLRESDRRIPNGAVIVRSFSRALRPRNSARRYRVVVATFAA